MSQSTEQRVVGSQCMAMVLRHCISKCPHYIHDIHLQKRNVFFRVVDGQVRVAGLMDIIFGAAGLLGLIFSLIRAINISEYLCGTHGRIFKYSEAEVSVMGMPLFERQYVD
jgi:hypothetical protein